MATVHRSRLLIALLLLPVLLAACLDNPISTDPLETLVSGQVPSMVAQVPTLALPGFGTPSSFETPPPTWTPAPRVTRPVGDSIAIHEIQGAGHISPYAGQRVQDVYGIVTAIRKDGFYLQDPQPDGDEATSEGLFVFTGSRSANVKVGDEVRVNGRVDEFIPGGEESGNLSITELAEPRVTIISAGAPLPAPVVIGAGGRTPPGEVIEDDARGSANDTGVFDPAQDGLDFYESLENMRVQVNNAVVVAPKAGDGGLVVLADNGQRASERTARGGILLRPGDANPERIFLDNVFRRLPDAIVGDRFSAPVLGIMDYSFGNFRVQVTNRADTQSGGLQPTAAEGPAGLWVASYNIENFDPSDKARAALLAAHIVDALGAPDLIALQEVQDNSGTQDDGVTRADRTAAAIINAVRAAGGPEYQYVDIAPHNNQDGGAWGSNIRNAFLYRTDRGLALVERPGGGPSDAVKVTRGAGGAALSFSPGRVDPGNQAWAGSRKPLAAEFTYQGQTLFVINCHFKSKGEDQPLFGASQPPATPSAADRVRQARIVNDFVSDLLAADSGARVIVLGDLNDFQLSDTVRALQSEVLVNLIDSLPENEQYTYNFEGNAQVLDQILVSQAWLPGASVQVVHLNSEFLESERLSQHDPVLARFDLGAR